MPAARRPVLAPVEDPPLSNGCPQAEAMQEVAKALNRIAAVGEQMIPAADTVHGFGERLDKLCGWLTGKWPWIVGLVATLGWNIIGSAPESAGPLLEAALKALAGAGG